MNQRDALHAAVCASPDDDLPRLVFADWCDENGEEDRAEFIRVQIELAKGVKGKKQVALQKREQELLKEYEGAWTAGLSEFGYALVGVPWFVFRRGFVNEISTCYGQIVGPRCDELFRLAPITALRFPHEEDFTYLSGCKHLLRIATLDVSGSGLTSGSEIPKLFRSKYLTNLTTLIARGVDDSGHLDAEGLEAIATSRHLIRLRHLDVSDNWLFDTTFDKYLTQEQENLFALGGLPALAELELHGVGLGHAVVALAAQHWLARLTSLGLAANSIGDDEARTLAGSPYLEHIGQLDLRDNVVDSESRLTGFSPEVKRLLKRRFGKRVLLDM